MADEPTDNQEAEPARETAVGHPIVEEAPPQPAAAPFTDPSGTSPAAADRAAVDSHGQFEQKPELFVAGAFVGAFVLGKLLKKLTGSDD
jgi:hypothetical protein